jgi:Tfp pilus assembly PilM family ATPase
VVLQAVKSHHVRELLLTCEAAGCKPDYVQSGCAALHNLITHEYLGGDTEADDAVAALDVGANGSNLVISSSHSCWFRNIGIGGETFTSTLLRPFKLTRDQAERLKRKPSAAKRVSAVYEALTPTLTHLVEEVQRSLKVHHKLYPELTVRRILGGGGGFAIHGLLRRLRTGR